MDWQVLERLDPWGQTREDFRNAHLIAQLANMLATKKDGKPWRAEDFLISFKDAQQASEEQSQQTIESMIQTWVAAANIVHRRESKVKGTQES